MSPLVSLPARIASRSYRFPLVSLRLVSAIGLLGLSLLSSHPAQAQNGWLPALCDAKGNGAGGLSPTTFTPLSGTESVAVSNTYPFTPAQIKTILAGTAGPGGNWVYDLFAPIALPGQTFDNVGVPGIGATRNAGFGKTKIAAPNGPSYAYASNALDDSGPYNGSVTVDTTGQLVAYIKLVWSAPFTPAKYPDKAKSVTLLLKTQVSASASITGTGQGLSATATASDGDPFNETASADGSNPSSGPRSVVGYHLVTVALDPSTGIGEVYLNGKTHWVATDQSPWGYLAPAPPQAPVSTVSVKTNGPSTATAGSSVMAWIKPDNRAVTISCPAIEPSYYKGPVTSDNPTGRYLHGQGTSNPFQADSLATYSTADYTVGGAWIASASFRANTPGFTNPSYAWSSDFSGPDMVGVSLNQATITGSWFLYDSNKLPATKTIRLDVQDGPQALSPATASNTYSVKWHQPFEQWTDCQPASKEEIDLIQGTPQSGIPLAQVAYQEQVFRCDFSYGPNQMTNGIDATQKILPVTQPFFSPVWQALIGAAGQPYDKALLGITLSHDVVNDADAFTEAKYVTTIGRERLIPLDKNGVIGPDSEYGMDFGLLSAHYVRRFLQGDAYDIHGYAGPSPIKTARQVFKVQGTGHYILIGSVPLPK